MQKGYFAAAWDDIKNTPGWMSIILRLALVSMIPIFGPIVVMGYLYGWARDIAWNLHRPMPQQIFGNEDGNLYKRGFFLFIISLVFALIPSIFSGFASSLMGVGLASSYSYYDEPSLLMSGGMMAGFLVMLISLALMFVAIFFTFVGSMRAAIYNSISSGFQLSKIWAMIRYDFNGLLRIFGISILLSLVTGTVLGLVSSILIIPVSIGLAMSAYEGSVVLFVLLFLLILLVVVVLAFIVEAFISAVIARALGYWTRQFEVHLWSGQDDMMPFEKRGFTTASQGYPQQPYQAAPYYAQPVNQQQNQMNAQSVQAHSYQQPIQNQQTYQQPVQNQQAPFVVNQQPEPVQQVNSQPAPVQQVDSQIEVASAEHPSSQPVSVQESQPEETAAVQQPFETEQVELLQQQEPASVGVEQRQEAVSVEVKQQESEPKSELPQEKKED